MERAVSAFIGFSVAAGFLYGLLFTKARFVPAFGGAAIFGAAAILLVGVASVLVEGASRLGRRKNSESAPPPE